MDSHRNVLDDHSPDSSVLDSVLSQSANLQARQKNAHFLLGRAIVCLLHVQVVQEYERAVIFRLGRLDGGGAKGPGH